VCVGCVWEPRPRLVKEIGLTYAGRSEVCHQDDTLFSFAVQVPHQALRTRLSLFPCLLISFRSLLLSPGSPQAGDGGAEEARTPDPLLAKEVLSQLSYGPVSGLLVVGRWMVEVCSSNLQLLRPATKKWWGILDSNQRPQSYQDCALTS
jgi:hypothetical protein